MRIHIDIPYMLHTFARSCISLHTLANLLLTHATVTIWTFNTGQGAFFPRPLFFGYQKKTIAGAKKTS